AGKLKDLGVGVGIALNPETPLASFGEAISMVDMALVMSVEAGFGGQAFNPVALEKLRCLRQDHPHLLLEIDGGIDVDTISLARAAGCDLFVVGSAIFRRDSYLAAIADLHAEIQAVTCNDADNDLAPGRKSEDHS
ncbi:MAG: hypothetical protein GY768_14080, partial [Planctomycetaceae bacterium]|nr:hypothetical protein [Planctomycetaceae bacterium]